MWLWLLYGLLGALVVWAVYSFVQWYKEPVPTVNRTEEWERERREIADLRRKGRS